MRSPTGGIASGFAKKQVARCDRHLVTKLAQCIAMGFRESLCWIR
ncbi:hypothetical protein [Laspinema olomoucense]|nr:hypothetical protein [Laspinema sp. D3d]